MKNKIIGFGILACILPLLFGIISIIEPELGFWGGVGYGFTFELFLGGTVGLCYLGVHFIEKGD